MRYGSLFTGIGGFDLAFNEAGMDCAWMCEIDKNCQNVLREHFEGVKIYDDIKAIGREAGPVDLVCGGFPCQDLSVAGKRKGLDGERSGLWFEFARVIDLLEPKWVVIENVPGLLSSHGGRDFAVIIRWLVERGYGVCWRILDSRYFNVAQRRRRVFIVASLGTGRCAQVLFEPESTPRDIKKSRKAEQEATGDPVTSTLRGFGHGWQGQHNDTNAVIAFPDPAYAVQGVGTKFGSGRHNQDTFVVPSPVVGFKARRTEIGNLEDLSPTINPGGGGTQSPGIAYSPFSHYDYKEAEQAATLQGRENRQNGSMNVIFQQNTRDEVRLIDGDGKIAGAIASQPGAKQQNYIANIQDAKAVVSKGNGEAWLSDKHTSLSSSGGGQAGQGYPAVLIYDKEDKNEDTIARESGHGYWMEDNVSGTLDTNMGNSGHATRPAIITQGAVNTNDKNSSGSRIQVNADKAVTLQGGGGQSAKTGMYTTQKGVRRLTPTECERLQAFPDGWTEYGLKPVRFYGNISEISLRRFQSWTTNAEFRNAIENLLTGKTVSASCIIKDSKNMDQLIYLKKNDQQTKNAEYVTGSLEIWDQEDSVEDIINRGNATVILCNQNEILKNEKEIALALKENTGKLWKIRLEESYSQENLSIISTWIKRITPLITSSCATDIQSICGFIVLWNDSLQNCSKENTFTLRMGDIVSQSDSTRYRQLGNAVTVSVLYWIGKRIMEVDNANNDR